MGQLLRRDISSGCYFSMQHVIFVFLRSKMLADTRHRRYFLTSSCGRTKRCRCNRLLSRSRPLRSCCRPHFN